MRDHPVAALASVLVVAAMVGCGGAGGGKSSASGATAALGSGTTAASSSGANGAAPTLIAPLKVATVLAVSAVSVVANGSATAPPPIVSGFTAIQFTLSEPKGRAATVHVEVDTADGKGFRAATQAPNPPGAPFKTFAIEGPTNRAAAPTGTKHVFLWDSSADARGTTTDLAQIRVWAQVADTVSQPTTISNVSIRNGTPTSRTTALDAPRRAIPGGGTSQLRFATLVDLNRDGKPDLVAVDQTAALIWVFLALGDGAFATPIVISAAKLAFLSVRDVVIADLDGDGIPDIAFADPLTHNLWVLPGKGDGSFQTAAPQARSFATGAAYFPNNLVVADVNGDGKPDLVVLDSAGTELRVSLNASAAGNPDFIAGGSVSLPVAAVALAAGDFDRDGKTDVVLANGNDTLSLLLSTSAAKTATFGARSFASGKKPTALAVLDANGDGKLDLAVTNAGDDNVSVLLGDGAGKLGTPASFATGTSPGAIAVGDLDGDGKLDLVVGHTGVAQESILLGDGKGNFVAKPAVANPGGDTATSIAVGDVNGDGRADLVFTTLGTGLPALDNGCVTCLHGNGSGTFGASGTALASTSPMPYLFCERAPVVIADVNLDGHPDIVAGNIDGTISVFTGSATGAFSAPTKVIVGAAGINALAVFDANGDGKPDIVALGKTNPADSIYVLAGDGTGARFGWQPGIPVTAAGYGSSIDMTVADLNGDGIPDLVIPNRYENSVSLLLGDGAGGYQLMGGSQLSLGAASPTFGGPVAARVADVNKDGALDLIVLDSNDDSVAVLLGPTFSSSTRYTVGTALPAGARLYARSLVVADLDRDGNVDFAFCEPGGFGVPGMVYVWKGDGNGGFVRVAAVSHAGPAALAVADVNDDGAPDLLVTSAVTSFATKPTPVLSFLLQGAGWTFAPGDPEPVAVGNTPVCVTSGDLNGDGRRDYVVANPGDGTVQVVYGR